MKQKLFLSIVAIAISVLSTSAQSEPSLTVNAGSLENIAVASDMHVILLSAPLNETEFSMSADAAEKLSLRLSDNTLQIAPGSGKVNTVYLYVTNLKTIRVESNSQVETIGMLNTPKVEVYVDGRSKVHLRTNGVINAHGLNDADVRVRQKSPNPVAKF
jgi:hypothetical protein